jgi:hypothetical protein
LVSCFRRVGLILRKRQIHYSLFSKARLKLAAIFWRIVMCKSMVMGMAITVLALGLPGCQKQSDGEQKGAMEKAGAKLDAAAEKAGDALNKAGEKTGAAMQKGGEKMENAYKDAPKKE